MKTLGSYTPARNRSNENAINITYAAIFALLVVSILENLRLTVLFQLRESYYTEGVHQYVESVVEWVVSKATKCRTVT